MSSLCIKIPYDNTTIPWVEFAQKELSSDYTGITHVVIDLRNKGFLYPFQIVIIGCLVEMLIQLYSVKPTFRRGTQVLNNHLNNIKLKKYWETGFDRDKYTKSQNGTTLCLWHISKTMIESYGMEAQKYFSRTFFNDRDLQPLSSNLVELFNNIFDHANSLINGYVITQYYPNLHRLTFSICDFGIGIAKSVNNFLESNGKSTIKDSLAIRRSIVRGFTSKSTPQNAGFGLSNVYDFVKDSQGTMRIISNKGYFFMSHNVQDTYRRLNFDFNGTLIDVSVNTNTFEILDDKYDTYDFY